MEHENRSPRDYNLASSLLGWQAMTHLVTARDAIENARLKLMACEFDVPAGAFGELLTDMIDSRIETLSAILMAHVPEDWFDDGNPVDEVEE